jgi:hypothetical protein
MQPPSPRGSPHFHFFDSTRGCGLALLAASGVRKSSLTWTVYRRVRREEILLRLDRKALPLADARTRPRRFAAST